jgi:hypothetical protein
MSTNSLITIVSKQDASKRKEAETANSEQRSVERWRAKRAATTHTECNFYVDVDAYLTQWHWTLE